MSNRVRIVLLSLSVGLAAAAPVALASAHQRESRRQHAPAEHVQAIGRRDLAIGLWTGDRRAFGSASARWSRVLSDEAVGSSLNVSTGPFGFGSALVGSAPVGEGPSLLAVDPATHTIYVANGNNDNGPDAGGDTVSVIDARRCDAQDVSRCKGPWPTITVGELPSGIAVDEATDTVYVTSVGDDTVSVFNGATCNALNVSGCGQTPAEVPVGLEPIDLVADPSNHTVYVANYGAPAIGGSPGDSATVSMINSATCTGTDLAACPTTPPPTVTVDGAPNAVAANQATHTVYVTTIGSGAQNGWSVFDANTCNATVQSGCGSIGSLIGDPNGPNDGKVDQANDTLYTANYDNTISAFDLRDCQAGDLSGCATDAPGTVTPWPDPVDPGFGEHDLYVAVDQSLHSVYVSYQMDAALVVVDTSVCNGAHLAACATLDPSSIHTGSGPQGVVLDPSTQTLYTANEVDNDISVIDASQCNAENTSGCRHPAPSVSLPFPGSLATDDAVHTAYVTAGTDTVAMINTQGCNAYRLAGCAQTPPQFTVGQYGTGTGASVAVDRRTHTVYIVSGGSGPTGTVSVINDRTCNAGDQAGCAHLETMHVPGGNPDDIAIDPATGTVYVATNTASGPNLISVFNGATCNALDAQGCAQAPATLSVGDSGGSDIELAINDRTNTLYVTNNPYEYPADDSVYVFDGATCDASDIAGCGQTPATITVGNDPNGLAVDPATDTIYVVDVGEGGDDAASVSVINGATCNGLTTIGCDQTPATVPTGYGALEAAIDTKIHQIYTVNAEDSSVSIINGTTCNASNTGGCGHTPPQHAVGNYPNSIAVDPAAGTAYVANVNNVSVIPLTP
jgi:DNA-binding beta-propeller fold protein YncE